MVSRGKTHRVWTWVAGIGLVLGLGLFLLHIYHQGERPDFASAALAAYEQKDWPKAADLARARLKAAAADVDALRILARASIRMGRDPAGITIYNDRLSTENMQPEDFFLLGWTLLRQGNEELAVKVWSKTAQQSPDHPELLLSLANLLARQQHLDEATDLAQRLARIPGWESAGSLLMGTNRMSLEDYDGAAEALQHGLERDPDARKAPLNSSVYRKLLARSLLILARPREADRWLEPLLQSEQANPDPEANWLASRSALQQGQFDRARVELAKSGTYRADNPLVPEPSPYAGSARCTPCHTEISKAHAQARHARSFHHGAELLSLPRPQGPLTDPDYPKVPHTFEQEGEKLRVRTKIEDRIFHTFVDYALGTTDRYVTMIGRDGDGGYRALRRSYFHEAKESGWGRTSGDTGSPDKVENARGQLIHVRDGVVRCLYCHVTNPRAFRDPDRDGPGPEAADAGIGCERCHGPGAHHIAVAETDFPDRAIVNVGTASAEAVTIQCRTCHIVGNASEIQNRREEPIWVRSPGATMTFSRCYNESDGALSCLTCHDPHRDADRSPAFYERKCLECHSTVGAIPGAAANQPRLKASSGPERNSKARPAASVCKVNPAHGCLSCHMPKVRIPVLHTSLTDHYIRVHREK